MSRTAARLAELVIELPTPSVPAANYVPFVKTGDLVFVAGQIPVWNGERRYIGRIGDGLDIDHGREAARICAMNLLAHLRTACDGDLDRVTRVVRLGGFVQCTPDFGLQPRVIDAASELLVAVFGDLGRHSRTAVGVTALPFSVAVEIDATFEIR